MRRHWGIPPQHSNHAFLSQRFQALQGRRALLGWTNSRHLDPPMGQWRTLLHRTRKEGEWDSRNRQRLGSDSHGVLQRRAHGGDMGSVPQGTEGRGVSLFPPPSWWYQLSRSESTHQCSPPTFTHNSPRNRFVHIQLYYTCGSFKSSKQQRISTTNLLK